jgi:hypothetical protein
MTLRYGRPLPHRVRSPPQARFGRCGRTSAAKSRDAGSTTLVVAMGARVQLRKKPVSMRSVWRHRSPWAPLATSTSSSGVGGRRSCHSCTTVPDGRRDRASPGTRGRVTATTGFAIGGRGRWAFASIAVMSARALSDGRSIYGMSFILQTRHVPVNRREGTWPPGWRALASRGDLGRPLRLDGCLGALDHRYARLIY